MSSSVALINPLSTSEALLFYATEHQNLALEHRPLGSDDYVEFQDQQNPTPLGWVKQPGQIAATKHERGVMVYGFRTAAGDGGAATNYVSLLSPVPNLLSSYKSKTAFAGTWSSLSAVTDEQSFDYIYFFRDEANPADPTKPFPVIVEFTANIKSKGVRPSDLEGVPKEAFPGANPLRESRLASIYDESPDFGKRRTVFFQRQDSPSIWYQHTGSTGPVEIEDSSNARLGTPMCLVKSPGKSDTRTVYLYYIDNTNKLKRFIRKPGQDKWTSGSQVRGGITAGSDISAVWDGHDAAAPVIRVFVKTNDSEGILQVTDDLSQK